VQDGPVEPGDPEDVSFAHQLHDEVEFGAGGFRAAGDVDMDIVAVDAVTEC